LKFIRNLIKFWFLLILVILGVYVGIHNKENVNISLPPIVPSITIPSFVALSVAFLAGAAVASLWFAQDSFMKHFKIRKLHRKLRTFEEQNPPMSDEPFFQKNFDRNSKL